MPEAATTSRELALAVLETNRQNIVCCYHQRAKGDVVVDGEGKYALNGQPYPRKLRKTKAAPPVTRPPGHLHCGCNEDDVLMDFYFWKTWSLTSELNGDKVTESMRDQLMPPRLRAFVVHAFKNSTGLSIKDLYSGKRSPENHEKRCLLKQIQYLIGKLNASQEQDAMKYFLAQEE
jgi:hypothetical protein